MTKSETIKIKQRMKELGIKHYIYGIKCMAGTTSTLCIPCKTDEDFNNEVDKLLSDNWNTEVLAIHLAE